MSAFSTGVAHGMGMVFGITLGVAIVVATILVGWSLFRRLVNAS